MGRAGADGYMLKYLGTAGKLGGKRKKRGYKAPAKNLNDRGY